MQKIKRKGLLEIYNNVCESWKEEITKLVLFQTTDEIEVSDDLIDKAFDEANNSQKEMLNKYFKCIENDISNIKDFKDILKISDKKLKDVLIYESPKNKQEVKINALCKIMLISEVLNNGWKIDWSNHNQYKYYPYFKNYGSGLVFDGYYYHGSYCVSGVAFYKNSDLATFAGKTFLKEYNEFNTGIII